MWDLVPSSGDNTHSKSWTSRFQECQRFSSFYWRCVCLSQVTNGASFTNHFNFQERLIAAEVVWLNVTVRPVQESAGSSTFWSRIHKWRHRWLMPMQLLTHAVVPWRRANTWLYFIYWSSAHSTDEVGFLIHWQMSDANSTWKHRDPQTTSICFSQPWEAGDHTCWF